MAGRHTIILLYRMRSLCISIFSNSPYILRVGTMDVDEQVQDSSQASTSRSVCDQLINHCQCDRLDNHLDDQLRAHTMVTMDTLRYKSCSVRGKRHIYFVSDPLYSTYHTRSYTTLSSLKPVPSVRSSEPNKRTLLQTRHTGSSYKLLRDIY